MVAHGHQGARFQGWVQAAHRPTDNHPFNPRLRQQVIDREHRLGVARLIAMDAPTNLNQRGVLKQAEFNAPLMRWRRGCRHALNRGEGNRLRRFQAHLQIQMQPRPPDKGCLGPKIAYEG